jgi:hypothetical protein
MQVRMPSAVIQIADEVADAIVPQRRRALTDAQVQESLDQIERDSANWTRTQLARIDDRSWRPRERTELARLVRGRVRMRRVGV